MAFPAGLTLVTVALRFDLPPAGGATGKVTFTAPQPLTGASDGSVVPPAPIVAYLAADGTGSVQLPATNDPQWTPVDFAYAVAAQVGSTTREGTIQLDYQATSVEFADLIQWDGAAEAGQSYVPLSQRGTAGGVATLGDDGLVLSAQLPVGGGGSGVSAVNGRQGAVTLIATDVTDSTATGRSVMTATSPANARSAIGAGTSSLVVGTTSGTAADGTAPAAAVTAHVGASDPHTQYGRIFVWNGSAYAVSATADIYIGPGDPGAIDGLWIDSDA